MTPEQEAARKKQLVSAAKALLSLQVGVSIGSQRISKILLRLDLQNDETSQVFHQFNRAILSFPVGNERLLWAYPALLERDAELTRIEAEFRPRLLNACIAIIGQYG